MRKVDLGSFKDVNRDNFSDEACYVLYDYLSELEMELDTTIVIKPEDIENQYIEYKVAKDCLNDYNFDTIEELEADEELKVWLLGNGGILIKTY